MYTYAYQVTICIHTRPSVDRNMPKVVFPEMYFYQESVRPTSGSFIKRNGYRRMYERIDGKFVAIGWIVTYRDRFQRSNNIYRVTAFDDQISDDFRIKR